MGQKEKLIRRLKSKPRDFTFQEAETLLGYLTYQRFNKGKTSGSRVLFYSEGRAPILLHKPTQEKSFWSIRSSSCWRFWNRRDCCEKYDGI